jgi:ribosomal protein S18 acetylase RimI-like enzyme
MSVIRQMRHEDISHVYTITCCSLDQYYTPDVFNFFLIQWPAGQLVACDLTGKVVGYLSGAILAGNRASVSLFAVDRIHRHMGVGNQLLEVFKTACIMSGCGVIQLEVRESNTDAIQFYQKRGFIETEHIYDFYTDHGNAVRMTLVLNRNS